MGKLFIVTGPSGSGKTSVVSQLLKIINDSARLITVTTRKPRPNEKNGIDYYFVNTNCFLQMVAEGRFIESTSLYGNFYGSPKKQLHELLSRHSVVFAALDPKGVLASLEEFPGNTTSIFITPHKDIRAVLTGRGDSKADTESRASHVKTELTAAKEFNYVVANENNNLEVTVRRIKRIIERLISEKLRRERVTEPK